MEQLYRVGNRIKIIAQRCGHGFLIGQPATIIEVCETDYLAEGDNGGKYYVRYHEIEPLAVLEDEKEWIEAEAWKRYPRFTEGHNKGLEMYKGLEDQRSAFIAGATAYATRAAEVKRENEELRDGLNRILDMINDNDNDYYNDGGFQAEGKVKQIIEQLLNK